MCKNVHSSFIHNSPRLETYGDKFILLHIISNEKEQVTNIHNNMDESTKSYTGQKKSDISSVILPSEILTQVKFIDGDRFFFFFGDRILNSSCPGVEEKESRYWPRKDAGEFSCACDENTPYLHKGSRHTLASIFKMH